MAGNGKKMAPPPEKNPSIPMGRKVGIPSLGIFLHVREENKIYSDISMVPYVVHFP